MTKFPVLYVFIILLFILLGIIFLGGTHKKKKLYVIICIGILATLGACRGYDIGNDTETYIQLFYKLDAVSFTDAFLNYSNRYELGLIVMIKLLQIFTHNPQSLLIISSMIIWYSVYKFIMKNSKEPITSCILIICFGFMAFFFSAIRASLAFAFILNAYDAITNKKNLKAIFLLFLAFLFHRTSIVFFIIFPLYYWKPKKKTLTLMLLCAIFVIWQFDYFLEKVIEIFPSYTYYTDSEYITEGVKLATVMNILVMLMIFILGIFLTSFDKRNIVDMKDKLFMRNLIFVSILIMIVSLKFNLLDRCAQYFSIFSIVYLPNCILEAKTNSENKVIYIFIIIILFVAYFLIIQILRPDWNHIFPYHFFWD